RSRVHGRCRRTKRSELRKDPQVPATRHGSQATVAAGSAVRCALAFERRRGRMGMLHEKVAVITGAGRGIGRGEALLFAEEGARVVANDLGGEWDGSGADPRAASQVAEEIKGAGGDAVTHFEDISEPAGADSLIRLALDT